MLELAYSNDILKTLIIVTLLFSEMRLFEYDKDIRIFINRVIRMKRQKKIVNLNCHA